jgi:opacity protein-like surface antigen
MSTRFFMIMVCMGACLLLCAVGAEAAEKSDIGFKGIGPRLGFVDPEGSLDGTAEFGVAFEFGEFVRQLHWDGSVSFWSSGRSYPYYDGHDHFNYDWTLRDFVLRSGVNYHFIEGPWEPYAGGGLGLHFFSWDYNGAPYYNNTSDTKLGLYIDGGVEHKFSKDWLGQLQLQFDFASPDQTAVLFNLIYRLR